MQTSRRGRGLLALIMTLALLMTGLTAGVDAAADDSGTWTKQRVGGELMPPPGPNPYLANTPDGKADYMAWDTYLAHRSADAPGFANLRRSGGPTTTIVNERQRNNDNPNRAQNLRLNPRNRYGRAAVDIIGTGPEQIEGTRTDAGFAAELNGSIPDAQVLPVLAVGDEVTGTGTIGDEVDDEFDFDFFALPGLKAGDTIVIDIDTADPFGDLDPFIAFWDSEDPATLIDLNDDGADSFDSFLTVEVPADGTYYLSVAGFGAFLPVDPSDSGSESVTGDPGSLGDYSYSISSVAVDLDYYEFDFLKGDILGANLIGGTRLELTDSRGRLLIGSSQDLTAIHPASSPLPGGGDAALSYVIDRTGRYTLAVETSNDYVTELRGFRPTGRNPGRNTQILYLDFDGGSVDLSIFGFPGDEVATLSPLADFLPNWGLGPDDEDDVIQAIVDVVTENLETDIDHIGGNQAFDIEIVDSRSGAEPTGPLVSRIIVGGTIDEFGIGTVGIAQSIDVGNFETSETAVVLLDLLSAPVGSPDFIPELSLNSYEIDPSSSLIELIGVGVGNVTAHEAGHFFANWHTDQFNDQPNIQDQGGNPVGIFGVGPDLIFGTADDIDVDFGKDVFVPAEGFSGTENTLTSIAFGLWSIER